MDGHGLLVADSFAVNFLQGAAFIFAHTGISPKGRRITMKQGGTGGINVALKKRQEIFVLILNQQVKMGRSTKKLLKNCHLSYQWKRRLVIKTKTLVVAQTDDGGSIVLGA